MTINKCKHGKEFCYYSFAIDFYGEVFAACDCCGMHVMKHDDYEVKDDKIYCKDCKNGD